MAQKLDNKPGHEYDKDDSDIDIAKGLRDAEEHANKPSEDSVAKGIAEAEKYANTTDGSSKEKTQEEEKSDKTKDEGFANNTSQKQSVKTGRGLFSRNKGKFLIGTFVTLALSVVGLAAFLPSIMTNLILDKLSDTFLGRAKYAVEQRAEKYVQTYVTKVIGGELRGTCGTTVNRDCVEASSLMGKLTEQWKSNRLEERLFNNHGIEFELDRTDPSKIIVKQFGAPLDGDGAFGKRSVVNKVIDTIDTETKFDGILTRRHIRSVLARKYGANKFCIIACDRRDDIEIRRLSALRRLKLKIYSQVAEIGLTRTSAYLLCLTVNCSNAELRNSESEAIQKILANNQSDEALKKLASDIDELAPNRRNLSNLAVKRLVEKLLSKVVTAESAKLGARAVPVAGQIYLAATILEFLTVLDEKIENKEISKYIRDINAQESALYATQMLNIGDDNQSRESSFEDSWASFQLINGFGKSRLWQEMNGIEQKSTMECDDGVVLSDPSDPLVCPEFKLQPTLAIEEIRNDPTVDTLVTWGNQYNACIGPEVRGACVGLKVRSLVKPLLDGINGTLEFAGSSFLSVVGFVFPPFITFKDAVTNFVAEQAEQVFTWLAEKALPRVIDTDAEDDIAFNQAAMGLDVLGNQFGRGDKNIEDASSIEGSVLSPAQQASLDVAIAEDKIEDMKNESLFARYLDLNNPESLAGSATLATASGIQNNISKRALPSLNIAGFFNTITTSLGLQERSYASIGPQDRYELFGVTQYGCALEDPCATIDPEELTPERCLVFEQARLDSEYLNEETGELDYTVSNPCAADGILVDSFTKSFYPDAEGATVSQTTGSSTPLDAPGLNGYAVPCTGDPRTVVRQGPSNGPYAVWDGIPDSGVIGNASDGQPIKVYVREACPGATDIKTVVIVSSLHGSENGGQFVSHELLYNKDIPDNMRIIAIPNLNAWGVPRTSRKTSTGVNLNRNFDTPNWYCNDNGSCNNDNDESNPSDPDYRGPIPNSEPETQALQNFLLSLGGDISLSLHYHDNISWVAHSGDTNPALSARYASNVSDIIDKRLINQHGGSTYWTNLNTGAPSLLVEMSGDQSQPIIDQHVNAVLSLFSGGLL